MQFYARYQDEVVADPAGIGEPSDTACRGYGHVRRTRRRPRLGSPRARDARAGRPGRSPSAVRGIRREESMLGRRPYSSPARPAINQTTAPVPRRRRNQLTSPTASPHAHTPRPRMKIERLTSCAAPPATAGNPRPANARSSGGFGNCTMGKLRGQPTWPRRQSSVMVLALKSSCPDQRDVKRAWRSCVTNLVWPGVGDATRRPRNAGRGGPGVGAGPHFLARRSIAA